jgi:hypothetical protein
MKLQFTDERINEFKSGDFYRANDGEAFEVDAILGHDLLTATHGLDRLPVFQMVVETSAGDEEITEAVLSKKKKADLLSIANQLQVAIADGDTKDQIIEKILNKGDLGQGVSEPVIDPNQEEANEEESQAV